MVAFGHTAVGTLVGIASYQAFGKGDIALGLIASGFLGILSHYLMDLIPHGHFFRGTENYKKMIIVWVIIFDLVIPAVFLLSLSHLFGKNITQILYILFAIGGAQLPDVLGGLKRIDLLPNLKIFKVENVFHMGTHWHGAEEKALLWGFRDIWQVLAFVLAVLFLFRS